MKPHLQSYDDLLQVVQGQIDELSLPQNCAIDVGLADSL